MINWKQKIIEACKEAGTYQPYFDLVINQLSEIMELRDKALKQFYDTGGNTIITHTNKNGVKNIVKHPALAVVDTQDMKAINYWRELGLTAKSYKQMFGDVKKIDSVSFEDIIAGIEG